MDTPRDGRPNGWTTMTGDYTSAWLRATEHATRSLLEAQRATLSAFGFVDSSDSSVDSVAPSGPDDDAEPDAASTDESAPAWEWERTVESPEDISVGDEVRFSKRLSDTDIASFAAASGDTNRLHLDDEFAAETRFGGRIAHGTLVGGLISAALARLPGLTIYLSQDLRFLKPVRPGTRLTAVVEVLEDLGDDRYRLATTVHDEDDATVIDGEAVVLIDEVPVDQPAVLEEPTEPHTKASTESRTNESTESHTTD